MMATMQSLTIQPDEAALSALEFLQRRIPAAPAAYLRQLLKNGKISGDQGPLRATDRLCAGTTVQLPASGRLRELLDAPAPPPTAVKILFETREILVVAKPAGLAMHAGVGHEDDHLSGRVNALLKARGDRFMVAPVQRLDLDTSGPVLFGKGKSACAELGRLFMRHDVEKDYLALVSGQLRGELYAGQTLTSVLPAKGKNKEATTSFRVLGRSPAATLLELRIHSGRQHQIRRQLADIGHPLYGDRRYRGPCPEALPRLFLHCRRLAFNDPFNGAPLDFTQPLPADLKIFLDAIVPAAALP